MKFQAISMSIYITVLCSAFMAFPVHAEIQGTLVSAGMKIGDTYISDSKHDDTKVEVDITYDPWQARARSMFEIIQTTTESATVSFDTSMMAMSGNGYIGYSSDQVNNGLIHYYAASDVEMKYSYVMDYGGDSSYIGNVRMWMYEGEPYRTKPPLWMRPWQHVFTDGWIQGGGPHFEGKGTVQLSAGKYYTFAVWTNPSFTGPMSIISDGEENAKAKVEFEFGDVPQAVPVSDEFRYQGRLNYEGSPADGNFNFQFKLYDLEKFGQQVGQAVTKDGLKVTSGAFSAGLSFGDGNDIFNGQQRWLEISVMPSKGTEYTTLEPRQPITVVPYALHALSAEKITEPVHKQDYMVAVEISGILGPDNDMHHFYDISSMDSETEVIEFQDGDDVVLRKRPGRSSVADIVLKRFVTDDLSIYNWHQNIRSGQYDRRNMVIRMYDKQGNMVLHKSLLGTWPYKFGYEQKGDTVEETISFVCEEAFNLPLETGVNDWSPKEPVVMLPLEVEISGVAGINFTEVSGLGIEVQVITFQDGSDPILRKRPGRTEGMNYVLKYLGQSNAQINEWYQDIREGQYARRSVTVFMKDSQGQEYLRVNMLGCWPSQLGAEFDSSANDVEQSVIMVSEELYLAVF